MDLAEEVLQLTTKEAFDEWTNRKVRWRSLTSRALTTVFTTSEASTGFEHAARRMAMVVRDGIDLEDEARLIRRGITNLQSLKDQLEYLDEPFLAEPEQVAASVHLPAVETAVAARVFLVHGRNDDVKERVARTLMRGGVTDLVILHEQPNRGRTIIEKFEAHASVASYAVVIATADDLGRLDPKYVPSGNPSPETSRARQNVILELGYFVGKLGRDRVTVLYEQGVDIPSDWAGVTYTPLDDGNAWRYELGRELRAADLDFDMNNIT